MSNHNPLIDNTMPDQTLTNVCNVLSYLQALAPVDDGEMLNADTSHGQYLLLACIREALDYEQERVQALRAKS